MLTRSQRARAMAITTLAALCACGAPPAQLSPQDAAQEAELGDACNLQGTWAVRFAIPVAWKASPAVRAGTGKIYQYARVNRSHTAQQLHDALTVCGVTVPDIHASAEFKNQLYGIRFPDALFDGNKLPLQDLTFTLTGNAPGAQFTMGSLAVLLGVRMPQPDKAPWPPISRPIAAYDADADGKPGVTVVADQSPGYSPPPVNIYRTKFAQHFHIALRNVVASAKGTLTTCNEMHGTAQIPTIAGKAAVNSRILGCLRTDGHGCSRDEAKLLGKLQSGYQTTGDAELHMQRVSSTTTCAQVRTMAFAETP